ncbi:MAG TPA: cobalamin biosynthesis protein, partial [Candidatus Caenarcaniphilales bacterium]|nr:cobalamin biosynthesis protein [Candidatus Caenarcaniphilales bacterium]
VLLAPLAGGTRARAWRTLLRDGSRHPSPNAGRLEAAFAGAFGVRLGGVNRYGARVERRPEIGQGPLPTPETVLQAVRLSYLVGAAAVLLCGLLAWYLER